jgi:murein L,D-transpeptidase YcbB/YkuD
MSKPKKRTRRGAKKVAKRRFLSKKVIVLAVALTVAVAGGSQLLMSHAGTKPSFTAADYKCVVSADGVPTQALQLDSVGGCVDYYKTLLSQYQKGSGMGGVQLYESQSEIGDFDAKAVQLTESFQQDQKMPVSGVVDKPTWQALVDACYTKLRCEQ